MTDIQTSEVAADTAKQTRRWVLSVGVLLGALFIVPGFMCACGHLDWIAVPLTISMAGLAWWVFLTDRHPKPVPRLLKILAVILATLFFFKNAADILWFGHGPLL